MHTHWIIFGVEIPICLEDAKLASVLAPFVQHYWLGAQLLWARLRRRG